MELFEEQKDQGGEDHARHAEGPEPHIHGHESGQRGQSRPGSQQPGLQQAAHQPHHQIESQQPQGQAEISGQQLQHCPGDQDGTRAEYGQSVHQATVMTGISRSAFYKYKDAVRPFNDMLHGRIVTFQFMLRDEPGVLSAVLNSFAVSGGNILTINQGIPISGCALVTIGAETSGLEIPVEELVSRTSRLTGVLRCEILAGQ